MTESQPVTRTREAALNSPRETLALFAGLAAVIAAPVLGAIISKRYGEALATMGKHYIRPPKVLGEPGKQN